MADLLIKPDPDTKGASPGALSEEDIYEDAGDLEFFNDPAFAAAYMAKIPKYVWEQWATLDDDAEIRIGTIRVAKVLDQTGNPSQKLGMLLDRNMAIHQTIPKEYDLEMTSERVDNTYVFTEKDLPGFKSRSRTKFDLASANMPARLTRPKNDKVIQKGPYDPTKRQPYFRRAVPKRTKIAAKIAHEVNCVAVDTPETEALLRMRTQEAMRPKRLTKYLNEDLSHSGSGFIQPGTVAAGRSFQSFIKTNQKPQGQRPQMAKTARIAQNELLDKLFACFRRYNYWSMKSFRQELQQPEAYLRETLEKIAVLAKSGRFATFWSLKPENKFADYEVMGDAIAPGGGGDGVEDSDMADEEDMDDEDIKFEDV